MFIFLTTSGVELESGDGVLLLENGDNLLLESSATGAVTVIDDNPVLAILYYYWHLSILFQMEPTDQVNPAYLEAWQNLSTWLMPIYDERFIAGDISNIPYLSFQA